MTGHWNTLADFLDMGGFGLYVWGSYGMVGAALVWEALLLVQRRRRALEDLRSEALLHPLED